MSWRGQRAGSAAGSWALINQPGSQRDSHRDSRRDSHSSGRLSHLLNLMFQRGAVSIHHNLVVHPARLHSNQCDISCSATWYKNVLREAFQKDAHTNFPFILNFFQVFFNLFFLFWHVRSQTGTHLRPASYSLRLPAIVEDNYASLPIGFSTLAKARRSETKSFPLAIDANLLSINLSMYD